MFSYRHAFHAGNHADVLKHAIFVAILKHLALKDKAFWVFDTHAGAGCYRLDASQARKNAEHEGGVLALWQQAGLPALLADYREAIADFDRQQRAGGIGAGAADARASRPPQWYPGSPLLALASMRPQDRMRCFEAHPNEIRVLQRNLAVGGRRVQIFGEDGFEGLKALLPPVSRRGVVLIDPSYEDKRDYARARRTLLEALERFATGTMVLWYPLVRRREAMLLIEQLPRLPAQDWLDVKLKVCQQPEDGYGLYGSGLFVINPPYTLAAALRESMPVLTRLLGQDATADWTMTTSADAPRQGPVASESSTGRRLDRRLFGGPAVLAKPGGVAAGGRSVAGKPPRPSAGRDPQDKAAARRRLLADAAQGVSPDPRGLADTPAPFKGRPRSRSGSSGR